MPVKKCPFCAEEIQEEAIKCKHCHADLVDKPVKRKLLQTEAGKKGCKTALIVYAAVSLIGLVVVCALMIGCAMMMNVDKPAPQAEAPPAETQEVQDQKAVRSVEIGDFCHMREPSYAGYTVASTEKMIKAIRAQDTEGMLLIANECGQILPNASLKKLEQKESCGGVIIKVRVQNGPQYPKTFWVPDIYLKPGKP